MLKQVLSSSWAHPSNSPALLMLAFFFAIMLKYFSILGFDRFLGRELWFYNFGIFTDLNF